MIYQISRIAFQHSFDIAEEEFKREKLEEIIEKIKSDGMKSLYKHMKSFKSNPNIDPDSFITHLKRLYKSDNSNTNLTPIDSCEREQSIFNKAYKIWRS